MPAILIQGFMNVQTKNSVVGICPVRVYISNVQNTSPEFKMAFGAKIAEHQALL